MLTSREFASLVIVGAFVLLVALVPRLRRSVAPNLRRLLASMFAWRLVVVYVTVLAVAAASTVLAWWIGLWDWGMTKDAIIITATVVMPMTFRSFNFKSGGALGRTLLRETVGLAALVTIYLDSAPLALWGELLVQPLAIVLVMLQAVARTDAKYAPARRLVDSLLAIIGLLLLLWTTTQLIIAPPDWWDLLRSVVFNLWLPLTLLPFFYLFGIFVLTDKMLARFRGLRQPLRPRVLVAVMVGTRLRLNLVAQFSGRYSDVATATGFRDGLRRMANFRRDLARRDEEEAVRLATLKVSAGATGVDADGCHLDRREFH